MWINKFGFLAINQKSPKDITEGILFLRLPLETRSDKIESKDEKLNSICGQEIGIKGMYEIPLILGADENKITHQF
jgi:hypothetical protein